MHPESAAHAPFAILGVDSVGRITLWNERAEVLTGHSARHARGRLLTHVFSDLPPDVLHFDDVLATHEIDFRRGDAGVRHLRLAFQRDCRNEGHTLIFARASDDIRTPSGLLNDPARLYRFVIDVAHNFAVFTFDLHGDVASWNKGAEEVFGYRADEIVGKPGASLFTEEDIAADAPNAEMRGAEETGFARDVRWHRRKGGSRVWVTGILMAVREQDGKLAGFAKVVQDETEQKRMEEVLRAERERLSTILQCMNEALIATDPHGVVTVLNRAAQALLDVPDAQGQPIETLFTLSDGGRSIPVPLATVLQGTVVEELAAPLRLRSRAGAKLNIAFTAAPLRRDGHIVGALFLLRDVGERHRAQTRLARAERLQALGVFTSMLVNELNQIFTIIFGNLALIKASVPDDRVGNAITDVEHAFERARELSQRLLSFSAPIPSRPQSVSVADLVRETVGALFVSTSLRVSVVAAQDLWRISADAAQLRQAFSQILINAIEAMPNGGVVSVRLCNEDVSAPGERAIPAGLYVRIEFEDAGAGIPRECVERVFDPYFTTKQTGSGLGLTIAHAIVKQHRGHIDVESAQEKGTRVIVHLPARTAA